MLLFEVTKATVSQPAPFRDGFLLVLLLMFDGRMVSLEGMLAVPGGMIILFDNDQMQKLLNAFDIPALSLFMHKFSRIEDCSTVLYYNKNTNSAFHVKQSCPWEFTSAISWS